MGIRRPRWPRSAGIAIVFVVAVAAALGVAAASRPAHRIATSAARTAGAPAAPTALPHFAVPAAYHVVYEVTGAGGPGGSGGSISTEQVWVQRPFGSVDITLAGAPPGTGAYLETVDRAGVQVLRAGTGSAGLVYVPMAPAGADLRIDAVLPAAVRAGYIDVLGQETVGGQSCTMLRSARSLRAGPLGPMTRAGSHVDSCVDADGVVLDERSVQDGKVQTERRAVAVTVGTAALSGADLGATGTASPFDQGGGSLQALTLTSRPPGGSWELPQAPAGFVHTGRFAVVPTQPQAFSASDDGPPNPAGLPGSLVVEMDDVYQDGSDAVVIQQGETMNGATFNAPAGGTAVTLGAPGSARLVLSATGSQIVAEPFGGQRFLRITGTLPPERLLALARSLVLAPGGTLTRLGQ